MKDELRHYLQRGRDGLLSKVDGLGEFDARRPLTPTGTNLLGLVKHTALMEAGYFGLVFGRPIEDPLPGLEDDAEVNADMWATEDESLEKVVAFYRRACAHADETITTLPLGATGEVPWWPEPHNRPTLGTVLIHMIAETNRHAGHADIVRETIDGVAGMRAPGTNMPDRDPAWWQSYHARLQGVADSFRGPGQPRG